MKIMATCESRSGSATRCYQDTDVVFGLLKTYHADTERAERAYERIKKGETVKVNYMGARLYLRSVGACHQ